MSDVKVESKCIQKPEGVSNTEWLRKRLLREVSVGKIGTLQDHEVIKRLEDYKKHPLYLELERQCSLRRLMGMYRYEQIEDDGLTYDEKARIGTALLYHDRMLIKLKNYINTGNLEMILDINNYCSLEYVNRTHPNCHFNSLERHED